MNQLDNFDWVARVIVSWNVRTHLRYVVARDGKLVASDGVVLAEAPNDVGLTDGVYHPETREPVYLKDSDDEFPDYTVMLPFLPKKAYKVVRISDLVLNRGREDQAKVMIENKWFVLSTLEHLLGGCEMFEYFLPKKDGRPLIIRPIFNEHISKRERVGCIMNCRK